MGGGAGSYISYGTALKKEVEKIKQFSQPLLFI
jgi:hypothetical protein